jgi:S1-C subfamily serine protease
VVGKVEPSVVTVLAGEGLGSGVVYKSDGVIITNEHVVDDAPTQHVVVAFADGRRATGRVVATDSVTDLAVVRADRDNLPGATFRAELPRVGELAVALGSPLGFAGSATAGIVSGLSREVPGSAQQGHALVDLIQTDAAISPGNSGGALVDAQGRVIGINEAYIPPQAGAVSIGFAIPAATVVHVVQQLLKSGTAQHAFVGIRPATLTPQIADRLGIEADGGVVVLDTVKGGPAARAGIVAGDVITKIDGTEVRSVEDFLGELRNASPGDRIELRIARDDATRTVSAVVADRPR